MMEIDTCEKAPHGLMKISEVETAFNICIWLVYVQEGEERVITNSPAANKTSSRAVEQIIAQTQLIPDFFILSPLTARRWNFC